MKKSIYIVIISIIIIVTIFILIFLRGKIFDKVDNKLQVNNLSRDTICFSFDLISSNKSLYLTITDKSYQPSIILPKKMSSYSVPNWDNAINKIKSRKLYLFDLSAINRYRSGIYLLDSNVINKIVRYEFPLIKDKLDSCDWIINYK